jgi:prevent-host-death family protein
MRFISTRELSKSLSKYIRMTKGGHDIIITKNGVPQALLTEISADDLEDYILAKHLDLEEGFKKAQEESESGKAISARNLLKRLDEESADG